MSSPSRKAHEAFLQPAKTDVSVWRYLDLAKYLSILHSRSLFFPRATQLGDPFEGSVSRQAVEARQAFLGARPIKEGATSVQHAEQMAKSNALWGEALKNMVQEYFVSCWHLNEHESAAMWKLYSASGYSVAIRTKYSTLAKELPVVANLGLVKYIDYDADFMPYGNSLHTIMHKRRSFEHEREVRAVVWELNCKEVAPYLLKGATEWGLEVPVEPEHLIEMVLVSPFAPPWFYGVVRAATEKVCPSLVVAGSSMSRSPLY